MSNYRTFVLKYQYQLLIIALTFLAWAPLIGTYYPIYDDFMFLDNSRNCRQDNGLLGCFNDYIKNFGFQRLFTSSFNAFEIQLNQYYYFIAIIIHSINSLLLFNILSKLNSCKKISLLLTMVFAIFPFHYMAITWATANHATIVTLLYLVLFLYMLNLESIKVNSFSYLVVFLLSFVPLLWVEYYLFASLLLFLVPGVNEVIPLSVKNLFIYFRKKPIVLVPSLAVVIYLILVLSTKNPQTAYPVKFNIRSLISPFYYQYSNVFVFQPLFIEELRDTLFYNWKFVNYIISAVAMVILFLVKINPGNSLSPDESPSFRNKNMGMALFVILLSLSLIWVFVGGYSIDTRKKYALLIFIVIFAGWLLNISGNKVKINKYVFNSTFFLLLFSGIISTWTIAGIWKFETKKHNHLIEVLIANNINGKIRISDNQNTTKLWDQFEALTGFNVYHTEVINTALIYFKSPPINVTESDDYDYELVFESNKWSAVPYSNFLFK